MKKFTLLSAILFMATTLSAQLANPNGADGKMTFIWDCENDRFATELPSNAYEIDQTFTFAVDITGTKLADWISEAPTGITRSVGFYFWNSEGKGYSGDTDGRFTRIRGNIYGGDMNFYQYVENKEFFLDATEVGEVFYMFGTVCGYASDGVDHGVQWWQEPLDGAIEYEAAEYTGANTSPIYFNDDYEPLLIGEAYAERGGYAYPCVIEKTATSIETIATDSPVIGYEYYDLLGNRLVNFPQKGIYIERALKADGTSSSTKILR